MKRPPGSGAPQLKVCTALFTTVSSHIIHQAHHSSCHPSYIQHHITAPRASKNALRILLSDLLASPSPLSPSPRIPHRIAQPQHVAASPRLAHSFSPRPPSHLISHLCSTSTSGAHTQTLCGSMSPYLFWRIRRAVPGSGVCGHISGVIRELLPLSPVQPPCEL